jgi:hypothetical protein
MNAIITGDIISDGPLPIEVDPRPCELCGLTVDRHEMVDDGEGPAFFCTEVLVDELTLEELERRAELRRQEDVAAILARWDELPPPEAIAPDQPVYRTAQSTVAAFAYVVQLGNPEYLTAWLAAHAMDAPFLLKTYEAKNAGA